MKRKPICLPCPICCLWINLTFAKRRRENNGVSGATYLAGAQRVSCNMDDPTSKTPERSRGACHHGGYTQCQL